MQNKILNNYRMRFILTFMLFFINCNAFGDNMQNIIITIKNKKYEAILYDNSTTKELIKKCEEFILDVEEKKTEEGTKISYKINS